MVIALVVMFMLIRGTKFSSRVNQVVVAIKLAVVAAVIVVGFVEGHPGQLDAVHPGVAAGPRRRRAASSRPR